MQNLQELLVHELRDLYDAEKQIVDALPKMVQAASSEDLQAAFSEHLEETKEQVRRLERAFSELGETPTGETCEGMQGLIEEGEEIIQKSMPAPVKDAALIGGAQRVEHYEIAAYGTARALADELGAKAVAKLLDTTLDEESEADKKLTKIATGGLLSSGVNVEAKEQTT